MQQISTCKSGKITLSEILGVLGLSLLIVFIGWLFMKAPEDPKLSMEPDTIGGIHLNYTPTGE